MAFRLFSVKLTKFPKGCQGRFGCVLCEEAESGSEIHVEHVQLCIHSYIIAFSVHLQNPDLLRPGPAHVGEISAGSARHSLYFVFSMYNCS